MKKADFRCCSCKKISLLTALLIAGILLVLPSPVLAESGWEIQKVDYSRSLSVSTRSLVLENTTEHPHSAYTGPQLYHAYYDGTQWHSETVDSSFDLSNAVLAIDSSNYAHISYHDNANDVLRYATNASGTWLITTLAFTDTAVSSLAVDSLGNVHVGYTDGAPDYNTVYATNASGTWVSQIIDGGGNAPSLALDAAGNVHLSYGGSKYATNASASWVIYNVPASGSLAIDANGNAHISYLAYGDYCAPGIDPFQEIHHLTNKSGSWVDATVSQHCLHHEWLSGISITTDSSNNVHISYSHLYYAPGGNIGGTLYYATDISGTWEVYAMGTTSGASSIAIDLAGKLHIGYQGWNNGKGIIYGTDTHGTWIVTTIDDDRGSEGLQNSMAVGLDDRLHISYVQEDPYALRYASDISGAWVSETVDDTVNTSSYNTSIAVDSLSKAHIIYTDYYQNIKYATNKSGSWVITKIGSGFHSSISVDSAGKVHMSWQNDSGSDLMYTTDVSGALVTQAIDTAGLVGSYSSIAVDSQDKVHISYYDTSNADLKYATNDSGAWAVYTVDYLGSVGAYTSIALDSLDNVHISYRGGGNLKYTTNASGSWVKQTIDSTDYVSTSIALGSLDNVHIIYYKGSSVMLTTNATGAWTSEEVANVDSYNEAASLVLDSSDDAHVSYYDGQYSYGNLLRAVTIWIPVSGSWVFEGNDLSGHDTTGPVAITTHRNSTTADPLLIQSDFFSQPDGAYLNGFIIFDYQGPNDFKYAGAKDGNDEWVIGYYDGSWNALATLSETIDTERWYAIRVEINGGTVKLYVDDDRDGNGYVYKTEATFGSVGTGMVGLAVYWSHAHFDNFTVYSDNDGDGYPGGIDCDDDDPSSNPGAVEIYYNGKDDDCNAGTPDDDQDVDGYPFGIDCNDNDPAVNPGAAEVPGNCMDDDCNAATSDSYENEGWQIMCIDNTGNTGYKSRISTDDSGNIHICFYESTLTQYKLKYTTNTSGSWITQTIDTHDYVSFYWPVCSIDVDSTGAAHISYNDTDDSDLMHATNTSGSWSVESVDNSGVGRSNSIAIDSNDKVHISYYDELNTDLKYATNASGAWNKFIIDSTGEVGYHNAIAVDLSDKVHISYHDFTGNSLKYATNMSGSWVTTTIESVGSWWTGDYTSIALDASGAVHISHAEAYYYEPGIGPWYNIRHSTNASGSWLTDTIRDVGITGGRSSIAVDVLNNVHIVIVKSGYSTNSSGMWLTEDIENNGDMSSVALDKFDNLHVSFHSNYPNRNLNYATKTAWTHISGTWSFENGKYSGHDTTGPVAVTTRNYSQTTNYMTIESDYISQPDGDNLNGFIVFDYQGANDFKYAGAKDGIDEWVIGYYDGSFNDMASLSENIDTSRCYGMKLEINGNIEKLYVDDDCDGSGYTYKTEAAFSSIGTGSIGLAAYWSHAHFDNFNVIYGDADGDGFLSDIDCDDNDEYIYPDGPGVRIAVSPLEYYLSVQNAYDNSFTTDILEIRDYTFTENLLFDEDRSVTIDSGFECSYTSNPGTTHISGSMKVTDGVVTLQSGTTKLIP